MESIGKYALKIFKLVIIISLCSVSSGCKSLALNCVEQGDFSIEKTFALLAVTTIVFLIGANVFFITRMRNYCNKWKKSRSLTEEIENINKSQLKIMRIMAHDLRSPLAGISGITDLLLTDYRDFPDDVSQMLSLIKNAASGSLHMINDLLDSGLTEEEKPLDTEMLNIGEVLTDCVDLLSVRAAEKQQRLIYKMWPQPIVVQLNYQKLWRAFNNIIVNAIKFSQFNSEIKIDVVLQEGYVQIAVADAGIGIADADCERIFEVFSPAKRVGTNGEIPYGLGLSISKKIIKMHGGNIWFKSQVGVGTTFFIELPIIQ